MNEAEVRDALDFVGYAQKPQTLETTLYFKCTVSANIMEAARLGCQVEVDSLVPMAPVFLEHLRRMKERISRIEDNQRWLASSNRELETKLEQANTALQRVLGQEDLTPWL